MAVAMYLRAGSELETAGDGSDDSRLVVDYSSIVA